MTNLKAMFRINVFPSIVLCLLLFGCTSIEKNKYFLDVIKFNNLALTTNRRIIALGGISKFNERRVKLLDCFGISGISYFQKKRPQKWGPFIN